MKEITLKNAEVVTQYNSSETFKTMVLDNGSTIVNFSVKTKINDRVEKSPVVFDTCVKFCKTEEEVKFIKSILTVGNIIDVKGRAERQKDKKSEKYYDKVVVDNISIIAGRDTTASSATQDDDLPF
jgi:hypothetical protein